MGFALLRKKILQHTNPNWPRLALQGGSLGRRGELLKVPHINFEGTTHIVYIKLQNNIINAQHHICPQKTPNHWYTKKLLIEKPTNALWTAQCVYDWLFSVSFFGIIQMCINLLLYGASRGWHLTFVDASVLLLGVLDLVVIGIGD